MYMYFELNDWPEATFFSVENNDKHWLLNGLLWCPFDFDEKLSF